MRSLQLILCVDNDNAVILNIMNVLHGITYRKIITTYGHSGALNIGLTKGVLLHGTCDIGLYSRIERTSGSVSAPTTDQNTT